MTYHQSVLHFKKITLQEKNICSLQKANRDAKLDLIESTEVSSCGLGRRPARRTIISNDHNSKLLIVNVNNFPTTQQQS